VQGWETLAVDLLYRRDPVQATLLVHRILLRLFRRRVVRQSLSGRNRPKGNLDSDRVKGYDELAGREHSDSLAIGSVDRAAIVCRLILQQRNDLCRLAKRDV